MRLIRNPELKGILALVGIAAVLALAMLVITGKITEWTGWRFSFRKPLTDAIVYVSDKNGHADIWTMKPDGSEKKALNNDAFPDSEPVVSPDGYTIAFISRHEGTYTQIFAMDADGSHLHRLTQITGMKSGLSFSSDGKSVIFICAGSVWKAPINQDKPDKLLPTEQQMAEQRMGGERSPYIWARESFDGSAVAAVMRQGDQQLPLWMKNGSPMPVPVISAGANGGALAGSKVDATWSRKSPELVLAFNRPAEHILVIANIDTGNVEPQKMPVAIANPDWAPDSSAMICEGAKPVEDGEKSPQGTFESAGLVLLDSTKQQMFYLAPGRPEKPKWSPDSRRVLFTDSGSIRVLERETGKTITLSDGKSTDSDPTWAPESSN